MRAERLSLVPCLSCPTRSTEAPLRPAIAARRCSLDPEQVGRVALYANVRQHAASACDRPLLLLHGVQLGAGAHDMRPLFEAFREERAVYAPDLPGFGSSERSPREYTPELYVRAIEALVEHATDARRGVDVVAAGLTCEYAAQAAVHLREYVRSLTLISPTGFAVKREQGMFERASRRGKSLWPVALLSKLGVSPLLYRLLVSSRALGHTSKRERPSSELLGYRHAVSNLPGAEHAVLALLSGALVPACNPQSIYTRVHCPTLILHEGAAGFGSLASFVKWHEYFSSEQVGDTSLLRATSARAVEDKLRAFWANVLEQERCDEDWPGARFMAPAQLAAAASY